MSVSMIQSRENSFSTSSSSSFSPPSNLSSLIIPILSKSSSSSFTSPNQVETQPKTTFAIQMPAREKSNFLTSCFKPVSDKTIYKPKYHAFSIDSLVGNTFNRKMEKEEEDSKSEDGEKDEEDSPPRKELHSLFELPNPISNCSPTDLSLNRSKKRNENVDSIDSTSQSILHSYMTNMLSSHDTGHHDYHHHTLSHFTTHPMPLKLTSNYSNTVKPNDHSFLASTSLAHNNSHNHSDHHLPSLTSFPFFLKPNYLIDPLIQHPVETSLMASQNQLYSKSKVDKRDLMIGNQADYLNYYNHQHYHNKQRDLFSNARACNCCSDLYSHSSTSQSHLNYNRAHIHNHHHDYPRHHHNHSHHQTPSSSCSITRKPKRIRTAFAPGQLLRLENVFERNRYVVGSERKELAKELSLSETQIKVWFQNRRTKHKREKHRVYDGKIHGREDGFDHEIDLDMINHTEDEEEEVEEEEEEEEEGESG